MIERPQYYVFTYDDGGTRSFVQDNVQIQLDADAPFRLMGIAVLGYLNPPSIVNMRFTRPDRSWMQRNIVSLQALNPYMQDQVGATGTTFEPPPFLLASPVFPNLVYPPNGVIVMDLADVVGTLSFITKIIFYGTKLFQPGAVWSPTYPPNYRSIPFLSYALQVHPPAFGAPPLLDVPFDVQPDADFVFQAGQHSSGPIAASLLTGREAGQLLWTAKLPGTGGNAINVTITGSGGGANAAFAITVIGNAISVQLQTDVTASPITTVGQALTALNGNALVAALVSVTSASNPGIIVGDTAGVTEFLTGGMNAGPSGGIGVKIKDYRGKYYMNDYVPVELLFGFDHSQTPGLFYPEIYIPRNQALYFDFTTLSSLPAAVAQLVLSMKGQKVYGS